MSDRSVAHATSVTERTYDATPARVFAAWADPTLKAEWFSKPDAEYELDFKIGGTEMNRGGTPGGPRYTYVARYHDIVADKRIIYAYDMYAEETLMSASLATVEFVSAGEATTVVLTEQTAFLDADDSPAARERGWSGLLDRLGEAVKAGAEG